jgi:hypothetical protein
MKSIPQGPRRFTKSELARVGVEIYCPHTVKLQCNECGQIWKPKLRAGGKLPRHYWVCPNGCNKPSGG